MNLTHPHLPRLPRLTTIRRSALLALWLAGSASSLPAVAVQPMVAAGEAHSLALSEDGTVWAWGSNEYGQLGAGIWDQRGGPIPLVGLGKVVYIAAGTYHSLAVREDGTVWIWGLHPGMNLFTMASDHQWHSPKRVWGVGEVVAVGAGHMFSFAVKGDGTLWAWGAMGLGVTGQPSDFLAVDVQQPLQVPGVSDVVAVDSAAESFAMALRSDGTLWGWGIKGQVLCSDTADSPEVTPPIAIPDLTGVVAISVGATVTSWGPTRALAVKDDGSVWSWGNYDSTLEWLCPPAPIAGLEGIVAASAGGTHGLFLKADGSLWLLQWWDGIVGVPPQPSATPGRVPGLTATHIAAGSYHSLAVDDQGDVWMLGEAGRRGAGQPLTPTRVAAPGPEGGLNLRAGGMGNLAPVGYDSLKPMAAGTTVEGVLSADDAEGDALTFRAVSEPEAGRLTVYPDGRYTFTPPPALTGAVHWRYVADDGHAESEPRRLYIGIVDCAQSCAFHSRKQPEECDFDGNGRVDGSDEELFGRFCR